MTEQEAAALLAIAASVDNRKPDPLVARSWAVVLDGYRFADCRDAIVEHVRSSAEYLTPTHIIAIVKRTRAKRIAEAGALTPPPDLSPVETCRWLEQARRRIGDGEPVETVAPVGELTRRDMRALTQARHIDTTA